MARAKVPCTEERVSVVFQSVTFTTMVNLECANGSIDAEPEISCRLIDASERERIR